MDRVRISEDICFDADGHSQVLIFSSKNQPSLHARVVAARAIVASGDYLRAGINSEAKNGPGQGGFAESFESDDKVIPSFVQTVVCDGVNGRETVEHSMLSRNHEDTSRSYKYVELDSPFPELYYYTYFFYYNFNFNSFF